MRVIESMVPAAEVYSIDESFADLRGVPYPEKLGREIRTQVLRCTGIPVGGVSRNPRSESRPSGRCAEEGRMRTSLSRHCPRREKRSAETLYREGRLSVSAIGERLHISKSTLYSYLRHRSVDIGTYQKSAQTRGQQRNTVSPAESAVEQVAAVTLRLAVENNSKFVRGRKRAKENIECYCLEPLGVKRLGSGNYELTVPYQSDEELDKAVHDLLSEIIQETEMRNCSIEVDAWEAGTQRRW